MHTIPPSRSAYNLPSRNESSFPERHAWSEPDDISHMSGGDVTYAQPGFPKLDIFTPGLSSFWQQNWLDQSQPLPHRGPHSQHAQHPHHAHHGDRIVTSPHEHLGPDFFTPSPISPVQRTETTSQAEWDMLRATAGLPALNFPWLPTQAEPKIKIEDDSDSNWSLNESLEEIQLPPLVQPHVQRLRRCSGSRVNKVSRLPTKSAFHTFRMNKRPAPAATTDRPDYGEVVILDGPGSGECAVELSPDDYAAKVLERRIAHKLSEKSRRNRLTAAIREIQKLMPEGSADGGSSPNVDVALHTQSSKVDVVEMAIGFIKGLKQENQTLARKVREAEEKLQDIQKEKGGQETEETEESGQEREP